jgi:hypothetical protein
MVAIITRIKSSLNFLLDQVLIGSFQPSSFPHSPQLSNIVKLISFSPDTQACFTLLANWPRRATAGVICYNMATAHRAAHSPNPTTV